MMQDEAVAAVLSLWLVWGRQRMLHDVQRNCASVQRQFHAYRDAGDRARDARMVWWAIFLGACLAVERWVVVRGTVAHHVCLTTLLVGFGLAILALVQIQRVTIKNARVDKLLLAASVSNDMQSASAHMSEAVALLLNR